MVNQGEKKPSKKKLNEGPLHRMSEAGLRTLYRSLQSTKPGSSELKEVIKVMSEKGINPFGTSKNGRLN